MISITQNQLEDNVLLSSVIESNGSSSMIVTLNQFMNSSARFSILTAANVTTLSITHNQFDDNTLMFSGIVIYGLSSMVLTLN